MKRLRNEERRIVIAGDGIAAVAAAMCWIEAGYSPYLLSSTSRHYRGLEAVPVAASRLFEACGLGDALVAAGARRLEEFVVKRGRRSTPTIEAKYYVVDRAALATAGRSIAVANGARVVTIESLPKLEVRRGGVRVAPAGVAQDFLAAIDATGASGVWTGPRKRSGQTLVADVYDATPPRRSGRPRDVGEVCLGSDYWAYRFATASRVTVGVIAPGGTPTATIDAWVKRRWSVDFDALERTRRRAAFESAACEPLVGVRASVGDSAMTHNPIAGEGIRFALASSLAAVAALRTVLERASDADIAVDYYRHFVAAEFEGHSRAVERAFRDDNDDGQAVRLDLGAPLRWCAATIIAGVRRDGYVVREEVVVTADGPLHRWVGAADLLNIRSIVAGGSPASNLINALVGRGLAPREALALLGWCVRRGILGAGPVVQRPVTIEAHR